MPRLLLGLILVAGFALRIWNNDYGLPYVWSIDEGSHFANHAVEMFWQDLDPGYYENPSAYTYLLYGLLRVMYGPLGWLFDLPFGNVTEQFSKDPTQIWVAARTLAAALCMVGVAATYWAARRLWGTREGLVAAAVLAFAFLPVAYSRVAVTDVGALAGVALALYGVGAGARGRAGCGHYALAGAGGRAWRAPSSTRPGWRCSRSPSPRSRGCARDRLRRASAAWPLGAALAALVFLALNPYLPGSFDAWWNDLRDQAEVASDQPKPGQEDGGAGYYLDSLTWGLGWAAALAALAGAAIELRRDLVRGLILVAVPLALFVVPEPPGPLLRPLAAARLPGARDARRGGARCGPPRPLPARRGRLPLRARGAGRPRGAGARAARWRPTCAARSCSAARTPACRRATGSRTRYPPELRVAIEPAVPGRYYRSNPAGRLPAWLTRCPARDGWTAPGFAYAGPGGRRVCAQLQAGPVRAPRRRRARLGVPPRALARGDRRLPPLRLLPRDDPGRGARARARDRRPRRARLLPAPRPRARLVREFSPYDPGAEPVPFSFDLSYNYYPTAYHRPGPDRAPLPAARLPPGYGPPLIRIPKVRELPPFAPRDEGVAGEEI